MFKRQFDCSLRGMILMRQVIARTFIVVLVCILSGCRSPDSLRTELYFGLSRGDGTIISTQQWDSFVEEVVTPRFPDGLTIIDARGQWRDSGGRIVREPCKVLILIHRSGIEPSCAIEEIRAAYKRRFGQESVLRITSAVQRAD